MPLASSNMHSGFPPKMDPAKTFAMLSKQRNFSEGNSSEEVRLLLLKPAYILGRIELLY